eukprot:gnl/MRDRNA2_/MRDRNA2_145099_c0_seq1.p1 gnl/MRDRNA2_/MRDRNA2_145099_c0~~gnl/MRDRNA2_/MRDRNA2_145099_c0_seq1.p1  ORF type:complete len:690 (+),score=137.11 gnl/MRDRNA2_/MRDRNA2_145099_c0_seq1:71-2140(+)
MSDLSDTTLSGTTLDGTTVEDEALLRGQSGVSNIHKLLSLAKFEGKSDAAWAKIYEGLRSGERVNMVNEAAGHRYALLHHAAWVGNESACRILIEHFGADPSTKTADGVTADVVAQQEKHLTLATYLSKQREATEQALHKLFDIAKREGHADQPWLQIYEFLGKHRVVDQLLTRNFGLLHHAAWWGNVGACQTLTQRFQANPSLLTADGQTPESLAAKEGRTAVVDVLREAALDYIEAPRKLENPNFRPRRERSSMELLPEQVPRSIITSPEGQWRLQTNKVLPSGWEVKRVRAGHKYAGEKYFYSAADKKAQWEHPGKPAGAAKGIYRYDEESSSISDGSDVALGTFLDGQISPHPFSDGMLACLQQLAGGSTGTRLELSGTQLPCLKIVASEIMREIQDPANEGAFFVLPSQLNGAEYPAHDVVVDVIDQYRFDHTGGPRGQLAVHPAVGQFIIDNACHENRPDGISAVNPMLEKMEDFMDSDDAKDYDIHLRNGYLVLPECPIEMWDDVIKGLRGALHLMRCLAVEGIPANGLASSQEAFSQAWHRVSLVYASAVPVHAYMNRFKVKDQIPFQEEIGRLILVGQYYGAIRLAIQRSLGQKAKIFMMPLGGGVFNNKVEVIAGAISTAIEMLATEGIDVSTKAELNVLTWNGNPWEAYDMSWCLNECGKLAEGVLDPPNKTSQVSQV